MVGINEFSGPLNAFTVFLQLNSCISAIGFIVTLHNQKWSKLNLSHIHLVLLLCIFLYIMRELSLNCLVSQMVSTQETITLHFLLYS